MTPAELAIKIDCYPTNPGDLVLVQLPADATVESARLVGHALERWAIERQVSLTVVTGGQIDLQVLNAAQLASMGLQRIPQ